MSDEFVERDEAGRFASSGGAPGGGGLHGWTQPSGDIGEVAFGERATELSQGYVPNSRAFTDSEAEDAVDDLAEEKIALDALFPVDAEAPVQDGINELVAIPATLVDKDGNPVPENVTVKLEEAGEQLASYEQNISTYVDGLNDAELAASIDQQRAEALRNDPNFAEEAGLDPKSIKDNAKAVEAKVEPVENTEPKAEPTEEDAHIQISKALENPIVAQALRDQYMAADHVRAQLTEQLNNAVRLAEVSFLSRYPEFRGVTDQGHLASIASSIQAQNPQRWAAIQQDVAQNNQLLAQQAEQSRYQSQQQAQRAEEQFAAYKQAQDDAFNRAVGEISRDDIQNVRDYLSDLGLSQRDINSLGRNPTAVDHRFQRALLDAARYRALQQAPRAVATRAIPPVAKPGRGEARHSAREMNLQQLEYELARTGSEEAGWRLLQAKMRN